jgi:hypothetical protein
LLLPQLPVEPLHMQQHHSSSELCSKLMMAWREVAGREEDAYLEEDLGLDQLGAWDPKRSNTSTRRLHMAAPSASPSAQAQVPATIVLLGVARFKKAGGCGGEGDAANWREERGGWRPPSSSGQVVSPSARISGPQRSCSDLRHGAVEEQRRHGSGARGGVAAASGGEVREDRALSTTVLLWEAAAPVEMSRGRQGGDWRGKHTLAQCARCAYQLTQPTKQYQSAARLIGYKVTKHIFCTSRACFICVGSRSWAWLNQPRQPNVPYVSHVTTAGSRSHATATTAVANRQRMIRCVRGGDRPTGMISLGARACCILLLGGCRSSKLID